MKYHITIDLGEVEAPDIETAMKEIYVYLDSLSPTNHTLTITPEGGEPQVRSLTEFEIDELDEYIPIGDAPATTEETPNE